MDGICKESERQYTLLKGAAHAGNQKSYGCTRVCQKGIENLSEVIDTYLEVDFSTEAQRQVTRESIAFLDKILFLCIINVVRVEKTVTFWRKR